MANASDDPTLLPQVSPIIPQFQQHVNQEINKVDRIGALVYCPKRRKTAFVKDVLVPHPKVQPPQRIQKQKQKQQRKLKVDDDAAAAAGVNSTASPSPSPSPSRRNHNCCRPTPPTRKSSSSNSSWSCSSFVSVEGGGGGEEGGEVHIVNTNNNDEDDDDDDDNDMMDIDEDLRGGIVNSSPRSTVTHYSLLQSALSISQNDDRNNNNASKKKEAHHVDEDNMECHYNNKNVSSAAPQLSTRAYWLQRTLRSAIYGRVRYGVVLRRRLPTTTSKTMSNIVNGTHHADNANNNGDADNYTSFAITDAEWEITRESCAVKEMEWKRIRRMEGKHAENPLNEIGALHHLMEESEKIQQGTNNNNNNYNNTNRRRQRGSSSGPPGSASAASASPGSGHVLVPYDIVTDSKSLYVISPYCNGGELFDLVERAEKFSEREARYWMKQILLGLDHLQSVGICHRDLSLENLLVHDRRSLIIDLGMCVRVPFESDVANAMEEAKRRKRNNMKKNISNSSSKLNETKQAFKGGTNAATAGVVVTAANGRGNGSHNQDDDHDDDVKPSSATNTETAAAAVAGRAAMTETPLPAAAATGTASISTNQQHITTRSTRSRSSSPTITLSSIHVNPNRGRRLLLPPLGTCGKWHYMSPEIYLNTVPFDGYAVDLWSAGVILFIMVTGFPPWDVPCETDERFRYLSGQVYMIQLLKQWNLGLSYECMDLLQKMLIKCPTKRLTIRGVWEHPWIANGSCDVSVSVGGAVPRSA